MSPSPRCNVKESNNHILQPPEMCFLETEITCKTRPYQSSLFCASIVRPVSLRVPGSIRDRGLALLLLPVLFVSSKIRISDYMTPCILVDNKFLKNLLWPPFGWKNWVPSKCWNVYTNMDCVIPQNPHNLRVPFVIIPPCKAGLSCQNPDNVLHSTADRAFP
jgi:hypothetical protein